MQIVGKIKLGKRVLREEFTTKDQFRMVEAEIDGNLKVFIEEPFYLQLRAAQSRSLEFVAQITNSGTIDLKLRPVTPANTEERLKNIREYIQDRRDEALAALEEEEKRLTAQEEEEKRKAELVQEASDKANEARIQKEKDDADRRLAATPSVESVPADDPGTIARMEEEARRRQAGAPGVPAAERSSSGRSGPFNS